MRWNDALIKYWCEHYYALRNYELNPFEQLRWRPREMFVTGSSSCSANYSDTCDLNWEFDKALKGLGAQESIFREAYLDGKKPTKEARLIYKRFCELLEMHNENNT
jgi:hypothetical protein